MSVRYYICEVCKQAINECNLRYCNCGIVACDAGCADSINLASYENCDYCQGLKISDDKIIEFFCIPNLICRKKVDCKECWKQMLEKVV
jgi:hypothetical protein